MKISNCVFGWGLFSILTIAPSAVIAAESSLESQLFLASEPLIEQSRQRYEAGQFSAAVQLLQQAADEFANTGDFLNQAIALSNLSLAYQKLGKWEAAQAAIDTSTNVLQSGNIRTPEILAQTLHVRGQLLLATGQPEAALNTWKQATEIYETAQNEAGSIASRINQAEALQAMGLYRTALDRLKDVTAILEEQPDSSLKAMAFLSLGNTLRVSGQLETPKAPEAAPEKLGAIEALKRSLGIARRLQLQQTIADASLGLGNTYQALAQNAKELEDDEKYKEAIDEALDLYEQAAQTQDVSQSTKLDAQLNTLNILFAERQWSKIEALRDEIMAQIEGSSPSRQSVFARVNLAQHSLKLWQERDKLPDEGVREKFDIQAAELLRTAVQQAKQLQDSRAESFALGTLGKLYEQKEQLEDAKTTTEKALLISQSIQAGDIAYQWQWQLGRVLKQQDRTKAAIAAYEGSVNTLTTLRGDLAATTPDLQFSFRENVEPIYRQFVELLLKEASPSQDYLKLARSTIEALQLAEIDNFFREACIEAEPKEIDQFDPNAAVIYSMFINDRLEVIASWGEDRPLRHYSQVIDGDDANLTIEVLRSLQTRGSLTRSVIEMVRIDPTETDAQTQQTLLDLSRQLYDWLIRPIEADLAENETETLVFVLDGGLRSVPMSILHDGDVYLIENYTIALAPGLQLLEANPLARSRLQTLAAGLSKSSLGFPALGKVLNELNSINIEVGGIQLIDEAFTSNSLQIDLDTQPFSVVHLATHGQFSSNLEETFVLAWEEKINVDKLTDLLQSREEGRRTPIDLLVLSACQTAAGDDRATLGLAGVAVRAGARSTIASLWLVDDEATSILMTRFYQELAKPNMTKGQAFRNAQRSLLEDEKWNHPYYWSAFVLVGNWN